MRSPDDVLRRQKVMPIEVVARAMINHFGAAQIEAQKSGGAPGRSGLWRRVMTMTNSKTRYAKEVIAVAKRMIKLDREQNRTVQYQWEDYTPDQARRAKKLVSTVRKAEAAIKAAKDEAKEYLPGGMKVALERIKEPKK